MTKRVLQLFNVTKELGWIALYRKGIAPQLSKSGAGQTDRYTHTFHLKDVLPVVDNVSY
jgi:hypothetical protein